MNANTVNDGTPSNNWFSSDLKYQGTARAEFSNPRGFIEGPVEIIVKETGDVIIEMAEVERFENQESLSPPRDDDLDYDLQHLLTGAKPEKLGGWWMIGVPLVVQNTCVNFAAEVNEPQGVFSSTQIHHSITFSDPLKVMFFPLQSEFETSVQNAAKYWVLPLSNYLFPFAKLSASRSPHPLRIMSRNPWVPFEFNKEMAFIEQVADYEEREEKLRSGQIQNEITAVMVGEIGEKSVDTREVAQWLPSDFLAALLSFATGTEVTVPWIEFRDSNGMLTKRIHAGLGGRRFAKGRAIFSNFHRGGLETLLSVCQTSELFNNRCLRIAILRLVKSGLDDMGFTFEDKFAYLIRAYEGLPHEIKAPKNKTVLDKERYDAIKVKIDEVQKFIQKLSQEIEIADSDTEQVKRDKSAECERLKRIAARMYKPLNIDLGFGELVVNLARKYGLHDPEVMARFYNSESKWSQKLTSDYRAHVMHGHFFDFRNEKYQIHTVGINMFHLQDLLVRIILKMLKYDGNYCPKVPASPDQPVDWVTPELPASELGYPSS